MATVYILYSKSAEKFYVGFTTIPTNERLQRHLNNYYQNKFTSPFKDWELFYEIPCESEKQARLIEAHIKKMKSKQYILNLGAFPEISQKLLEKYNR